jgi:hypothetical protein
MAVKRQLTTVSEKFAEALNQKFADKEIGATAGKNFDKIVVLENGVATQVIAFIERETGKLFKPAGWSVPTKVARYDLSDDDSFARTVELADPFGRYLYSNFNPNTGQRANSIG